MEILQILLSLFSNGQNMQVVKEVFSLLKQNDFDIKKTILNLDAKTIEPIIEQFVKNINNRLAVHNLVDIWIHARKRSS